MGRPKGSKISEEQKRKVSESLRGRKRPREVVEKVREALRKRSKSRVSWTAKEWRRMVLERDGHKCAHCGSLGPYFHVHHIVPWKKSAKLRFEVSNGQTLCASCHAKEGWKNKELSEKGLFKKGHRCSEEHCRKISEALKGKPTWNKGGTSWNKGKSLSEETKKRISESRKGKPSWNKGIPMNESSKEKLSRCLKGRKAWNKGISCSEEKKMKISVGLKKYFDSR